MGNMLCLQELNLRCCENLNVLPESFGELAQLTRLDMSGCPACTILPLVFRPLLGLPEAGWLGADNCKLSNPKLHAGMFRTKVEEKETDLVRQRCVIDKEARRMPGKEAWDWNRKFLRILLPKPIFRLLDSPIL